MKFFVEWNERITGYVPKPSLISEALLKEKFPGKVLIILDS